MRRLAAAATTAVLTVVGLVSAAAAPASAQPVGGAYAAYETDVYWDHVESYRDAIEWEMVDEINLARSRRGLSPLRVQDDIRAVARRWSQHMRDGDRQYHNPNMGTEIGEHAGVAENIWGKPHGGSHVMHEGFMDSAGHRANILNPRLDEVGVGYAFDRDTSKWWVTVNFRSRRSGTTARPEPTRPAPRPSGREHGVVPVTDRIAGADRIDTALQLSARLERADTVVIARADGFADALAGGPLAAAVDGPLLLTASDRLDARVVGEVERLGATSAYLLGGAQALSAHVERQLSRAGIEPVRLAGPTRFATAAAAAAEAVARGARADQAYVADGTSGWPDALSASARAARLNVPLLLVGSGQVPAVTARAISELGGDHGAYVTVVGGTGAISDGQFAHLDRANGDAPVERIAGGDRYATSAAVAGLTPDPIASSRQPADKTVPVWVATGANWPDALAAGPAAAAAGARLLLVDGTDPLSSRMSTLGMADHLHLIDTVTPVGGTGAVSDAALASLRQRLR